MVTKGIVEEIVSANEVKVRMPVYDKIASNGTGTGSDNEAIASICCFPNVDISINVGDIVYLGFEDNNRQKPIVLGYLNGSFDSNRYTSVSLSSLKVNNRVQFPIDTSIGDVSYTEIEKLKNLTTNIQEYLNKLNDLKDKILDKIKIGEEKNTENEAKLLEETNKYDKTIELINYIKDTIGLEQDTEANQTLFGQLAYANNVLTVLLNKIGNIQEDDSIMNQLNSITNKIDELEGSYSNGYGKA